MFTGLVEDVGVVRRCDRKSDALVVSISSTVVADDALTLGASIAINGVCLTATDIAPARGEFTVLAGAETLRRTALGELRIGHRVNLERALRVGDRLGGHMMQGHVDGVATLASRRDLGANLELGFRPPRELLRYVVEKGSIAVDGISLTVNQKDQSGFSVALIPHTVLATALAEKPVGARVNVEVDVIGKYVESLLQGYQP